MSWGWEAGHPGRGKRGWGRGRKQCGFNKPLSNVSRMPTPPAGPTLGLSVPPPQRLQTRQQSLTKHPFPGSQPPEEAGCTVPCVPCALSLPVWDRPPLGGMARGSAGGRCVKVRGIPGGGRPLGMAGCRQALLGLGHRPSGDVAGGLLRGGVERVPAGGLPQGAEASLQGTLAGLLGSWL